MPQSEFRLNIVVTDLGARERADEHMERFADEFERLHPEVGAVMAANYHLNTLDATFSLDAKDAREAVDRGSDIFCEVANATAIEATDVVGVSAALVGAEDRADRLADELALT